MSRFDLEEPDLVALLEGEPHYRVAQVRRGLLTELREPCEMTNLPRSLRTRLESDERVAPAFGVVAVTPADGGETLKWLLEAGDGARVETVLMHYPGRTTVCVSSQAGCAMGCSFCATGQLGFARNLSSGEIVEQVARAQRAAGEAGFGRVSNVVFMGMGEPLANTGNVLRALRRLNTDVGIGARAMTVSTVGLVPGIEKLALEPLQVNLAVSLHAANDADRDALVPINRRYPLARLAEACARYLERTRRRLSLEWALIADVNDRDKDAAELAAFARPLGAHVNLIPLNPTPGYPEVGSDRRRVQSFRRLLVDAGVNVTVRDTRGREAAAACGQLAAGLETGSLRRRPVGPLPLRTSR